MPYLYSSLVTAFMDTTRPVVESTILFVYADNDETASHKAILEASSSIFPTNEGWSKHQAVVDKIDSVLRIYGVKQYLHVYAIRAHRVVDGLVYDIKVALKHFVDTSPEDSYSASLEAVFNDQGLLGSEWVMVIDHFPRLIEFHPYGVDSLN